VLTSQNEKSRYLSIILAFGVLIIFFYWNINFLAVVLPYCKKDFILLILFKNILKKNLSISEFVNVLTHSLLVKSIVF